MDLGTNPSEFRFQKAGSALAPDDSELLVHTLARSQTRREGELILSGDVEKLYQGHGVNRATGCLLCRNQHNASVNPWSAIMSCQGHDSVYLLACCFCCQLVPVVILTCEWRSSISQGSTSFTTVLHSHAVSHCNRDTGSEDARWYLRCFRAHHQPLTLC